MCACSVAATGISFVFHSLDALTLLPFIHTDDIYWGNVGKAHEKLQIGYLISLGLTVLLCVFWTIPVSFVVSLTEPDSLKNLLPFLENTLNDNPWIGNLLQQAGPIILILLNALLPFILGEFCKLEGPISSSVLGASLFVKLSAFMVIQTFFVSAIAGSLTKSLQCILDDWTQGIDFLASALPGQATFYVQLLLIRTCIGQGIELLRIVPIVIATVRSKVGPNLTDKERNSTWMGLRPFADPTFFQYPEVSANGILYFTVLFGTFVFTSLRIVWGRILLPILSVVLFLTKDTFASALCWILILSHCFDSSWYIPSRTPIPSTSPGSLQHSGTNNKLVYGILLRAAH